MRCLRYLLVFIAFCLPNTAVNAQAIPVALEKQNDAWNLLRDGQPYAIRGVGGITELNRLAALGANSIRTWGVDQTTTELLDRAHELGLSVALGIWLEHERHGFDYSDEVRLAEQLESVRQAVLAYKDHPAVLLWGVGNEMEGYQSGDDPRIWNHVEDCARLIKTLDPHHPTMTVIAEIGGRRLPAIAEYCPSIDIVGINSYGGAASLPERFAASGIDKPYIVAEFGPLGSWELPKTSFGAVPEPTSQQKAEMYARSYAAFSKDTSNLGSYAFLWGSKIEATPTWFGMLLEDGSRVAAVDVMSEAWTGSPLADLCPRIEPLSALTPMEGSPGSPFQVALATEDPEGKPLTVAWTLINDEMRYNTGGDEIDRPASMDRVIQEANSQGCRGVLPQEPGVYRLCVLVKDPAGNAATANLPVYVKRVAAETTPRSSLPQPVYQEASDKVTWIPSGYMGSTEFIVMDPAWAQNPYQGNTCLKVSYNSSGNWGGVAWQTPAGDWGDQPGGLNLGDASTFEFWARGERGGEKVNFGYGLIGGDKPYADTARAELTQVVLTDQWKRYHIDIPKGADMSRIKTGFYWSLAGQQAPVVFYLDEVVFR